MAALSFGVLKGPGLHIRLHFLPAGQRQALAAAELEPISRTGLILSGIQEKLHASSFFTEPFVSRATHGMHPGR